MFFNFPSHLRLFVPNFLPLIMSDVIKIKLANRKICLMVENFPSMKNIMRIFFNKFMTIMSNLVWYEISILELLLPMLSLLCYFFYPRSISLLTVEVFGISNFVYLQRSLHVQMDFRKYFMMYMRENVFLTRKGGLEKGVGTCD